MGQVGGRHTQHLRLEGWTRCSLNLSLPEFLNFGRIGLQRYIADFSSPATKVRDVSAAALSQGVFVDPFRRAASVRGERAAGRVAQLEREQSEPPR
jgi:hypothetical protein